MADDNSDGNFDSQTERPGGGLEALTPNVSEDRPLDALVPGMGPGAGQSLEHVHENAPGDVGAIHPRVLEVGLEEGREWTLALWDDPGASKIRGELLPLMRATIMRELSRPPAEAVDDEGFVGMRILSFESLREETRDALSELHFSEEPYDPEQYSERMKAWRNEATAADLQPPARPTSIWNLPAARRAETSVRERDAIVSSVTEQLGGEVWGETPGGLSKLYARELERREGIEIGLDARSLRAMRSHAVPEADGAIRWVPPVVFQALCDYVGVVLHGAHGVRVQWGLCEPDERGLTPPPMFRTPGEDRRIPIGRALVDWCVFPDLGDLGAGEEMPLADRVAQLAESLQGPE